MKDTHHIFSTERRLALNNSYYKSTKLTKCRIMELELAVDMEDHHMEVVVVDMVAEAHHTAVSICHTKQFYFCHWEKTNSTLSVLNYIQSND